MDWEGEGERRGRSTKLEDAHSASGVRRNLPGSLGEKLDLSLGELFVTLDLHTCISSVKCFVCGVVRQK